MSHCSVSRDNGRFALREEPSTSVVLVLCNVADHIGIMGDEIMGKYIKKVTLPDGRKALEVEELLEICGETQGTFSYFIKDKEIDKSGFSTDYWGRITELRQHEK